MSLHLRGSVLFLLTAAGFAHAAVSLPALLSDHAVLQRSAQTSLWGTAAPGEKVKATLSDVAGEAVAGADGKWKIGLDLSKVGPGPFDLVIEGTNKIKVSDVVVGEVWVASGQSNMEFPVKYANNSGKEIAASADPQFRSFHVNDAASSVPLESAPGSWVIAGPSTTGAFSAVGYFFCKKLEQELATPVGLINCNWGGTPVEAWTSSEALDSVPELKEGAARNRVLLEGFPARAKAYADAVAAWEAQNDRTLPACTDPSAFAGVAAPTADWKPVHLPGSLAPGGLPDAGAIWIRRTVTLPADVIGGHAPLILGAIPGFDEVYWNGVKFGETKPESGGLNAARRYYPSGVALQLGQGILAVRMAVPVGGAALPGPIKWGSLTLDGDWLARTEKPLPPVTAEAKAAFPPPLAKAPNPQNTPSYLFNGMVAPITPYSIRGVVWYQGESNSDRAFQYQTSFPLMIQDWRRHWAEGDFPFYFCQLANYMARKTTPSESAWAELREAQAKTLSQPNTGMAVLIDCGDEGNIHPHDKQTPGARLAALALANTYGKKAVFAGPTYRSMTIEDDSIRVKFTNTDGGLAAQALPAEYAPTSEKPNVKVLLVRNVPNSPIEGFAICGEDRAWQWAEAKIDGDSVVVHAAAVAKPVAVRYAWADDPICNLYNGLGFPAVPFRTDDFPEITRNNKL